MESLLNDVLRLNRNPTLSPWFLEQLNKQIFYKFYYEDVDQTMADIIYELEKYKQEHNISTVVIGMSGGIDSALTASLFKAAGWTVKGFTLPIYQKVEETDRGREACDALGIDHSHIDLTAAYKTLEGSLGDSELYTAPIRKGNVRARLRMITLYNQAAKYGGLVASTDNLSELAAGFWTLHGDVGDVSPIQSLTKSWEVPKMAELMSVPESIINAVPTDGLGISTSDEEQLGANYLEFDIVLQWMFQLGLENTAFDASEDDLVIISNVQDRIRRSYFKRHNPFNLDNITFPNRYAQLEEVDAKLHSEK